jgi:hypothetical protein
LLGISEYKLKARMHQHARPTGQTASSENGAPLSDARTAQAE